MSALGMVDTYLAIIVPALAGTMGLYLMKQFMESSVADSVLESARLDGASEFRTFLTIAMMPFAYSITAGIGFGVLSYVLIDVCEYVVKLIDATRKHEHILLDLP